MNSFKGVLGKGILLCLLTASNSNVSAATMVNRYSFSGDVNDTVSGANGTLEGGATISGGAVILDGSSGYVDLPNGLVSTMTNASFEAWLTDNGSGAWGRIFDFGFSTAGEGNAGTGTDYLFVTPFSGGGTLRAGILVSGAGSEQIVQWSGTSLPTGVQKHVVLTIDSNTQTGRLYVDGELVGENTGLTFNPSQLGYTDNNWLGRSQWSADAFLNASITEFRIYDGALTPAEVQENFVYGPDVAILAGPVAFLSQPASQVVGELQTATFATAFSGTPPVGIQWRRAGVNIPGATNSTYSFVAGLTNNGVAYSVVLTNAFSGSPHSATSTNAILSVTADVISPLLVSAASLYPDEVLVSFSEGVSDATGTNIANYSISRTGGTLAISSARFGASKAQVILTTAAQALGTNYTLTVNNIRDRAVAANLISPGSQTSFIATTFLNSDVGSPVIGGTLTAVAGGWDMTAAGTGISGAADQCSFSFKDYTGDFDLKVRVADLSWGGIWTRAALMARDGLTANAAFAGSVATPGPTGCHFEARNGPGFTASMAGTFPVNYPNTWLRLRRVGNVFDGFASLDGSAWELLGTRTIGMSNVVQVGFALTSANAGVAVAAQFRDFGDASGTITTNATLPFETLGPSSRRTALVISELMYHPRAEWEATYGELEFVEIWNSGLITEDLTGHKLTGEIDYNFPNGTTIAPGQFLVLAKDPAAAHNYYGGNFLGPYTGKLSNGGGTLRLRNELGGILLEVQYDNKMPWPVAADGSGHSLVLNRPSYGENDFRAWAASDALGGSPGGFEPYGHEPVRGVVINEFLAHTDLPQVDFIELFNTQTQAVNLSGAWLSDEAGTNKYRIPNGTTIPARGHLAFTANQLGFALAADGEQIFLVNSNQDRVLDAINFDGQENGVSVGRYPSGASGWQRLNSVTPESPNSTPRLPSVVINEIMYHPISEDDSDEYVEIFNRSGAAVNIGNWRLQGGISYTFPSNTVIAAGGYFVVAADVANLLGKYPQLNNTNTFGDFSGKLSNRGERIVLSMPDDLVGTNGAVVTTNIFFIPVDELTYADGGRWGRWSDGGGSSLELIDPDADNRLAANWADSDESAKSTWTTVDLTDTMENGQIGQVNEGAASYGVANRFEFFLQGAGESLVDNLEFRSNGGANLIANADFSSDATGWTRGGVLRNSYAESGVGIAGSTALHLVSTARGDTGPNKVFRALSSTAATGAPNTGTIRAQVRWLKGDPYVLLRVRGNWMEASQRLNIPANLGSPGLPNSTLLANAGPALVEVEHAPVLPAAAQSVVVTAQAIDPDGISAVTLLYRVDPSTSYTQVSMLDNGAGGDAVPGDGLYSASIPGQNAGTLVAFYVSGADGLGAVAQFPSETPTRECHVRWGETVYPGSIGTYRLWLTAANIAFWTSRERNANDPIDATFVYGNQRAIYNVDTLYSGSPFHTPAYNGPLAAIACDYEVNFRPDDRFLGSEPFVLTAYDVTDGNFFFNDDSAQVDLTGNWIARKLGQQYNYRRHIHVVVNGQHRGTIYDDAQQPNSEMIAEYFPADEHGELRKIESWFEFADNGQDQGSVYATITRYDKSTGAIDPKRYRWNWRPRATDNPNEWTALTNLVAAVNANGAPNYEALVQTWMDVPNFLGPIITHHICGSWDSYAYQRGKNMFAYKPDNEPWRLLMWDIEIALGAGGNGTTDSIYSMFDSTLLNLINSHPAFNRIYLRGFREAATTFMSPGVVDQQLDERYAAFQQHGINLISPQFIKNYLNGRRTYLLSILPNASFAVATPAYQVVAGSNVLTLTGVAPLVVAEILINGNLYPITWTSTTAWQVSVPLNAGTNVLNITAADRNGNLIAGATGQVTANYTGATIDPSGWVALNEICYRSDRTAPEFVELFNSHPNFTFDLSGWRLNGVDYVFPAGATLPPRTYLVLTEDPFAYNQNFGSTNVAYARFGGSLDNSGETLTLFRPGVGTNEIVVDRVRYEAVAPWPVITNTASLQLRDIAQDNSRVANWGTAPPVVIPPSPLSLMGYSQDWRYNQTENLDGVNWTAPAYNDSAWPAGPGLLTYENNTAIVALRGTILNDPRTGNGSVSAGHAYYFRTTLVLTNAPAGYEFTAGARIDDGAVFYVNDAEVQRIRMNATATILNTTLATGTPTGNDATTDDVFVIPASAFVAGTNLIAVSVHQSANTSSDITFGLQLNAVYTNPASAGAAPLTPGAANSVVTNLPAFPPLWLNELQANNVTGPTDNFGQHDPWAEVINTSATNVSLTGYYLTDSYTNLTKWPFPGGAALPAGFTTIWCDNQTNQIVAGYLHAGIGLGSGSGQLALARVINGQTQVVDYLTYDGLAANWSYGDVPDAQPFYRRSMFYATPGGTNNSSSAPLEVYVNEWMADNTVTLADPADGNYEDWFELYNPGTNAVDLGGYFLTDDLADPFKFQVPANDHYVIPAGGYLLVWADNESDQNSTNHSDLHVDFALSKGGESLGVFAADGTTIDAIIFGAQTSDQSEGRFPNGAANIYAMPTPTPGAANFLPNTPPTLAPISNQVVTLGQTLTLTAVGSDTDVPVQTLTYSLVGAPFGASIGAHSGVLNWTPAIAPATNLITVVVTDNGTPNLTAMQGFAVITAPIPGITSYQLSGNEFLFSWPTYPGQKFRVDFKDDLNYPSWTAISGVLQGTGSPLSFTNTLDDEAQRFFRLTVLP